MSIPDILQKIKGEKIFDTQTRLFMLVVIGVGVSAFLLGRLSMTGSPNMAIKENTQGIAINTSEASFKAYNTSPSAPKSKQIQSQGGYVASKNGKLYYTAGCSGAKRIKPANEVWFNSSQEAESLGYTRSSSC